MVMNPLPLMIILKLSLCADDLIFFSQSTQLLPMSVSCGPFIIEATVVTFLHSFSHSHLIQQFIQKGHVCFLSLYGVAEKTVRHVGNNVLERQLLYSYNCVCHRNVFLNDGACLLVVLKTKPS